jgi:hypothetical protein
VDALEAVGAVQACARCQRPATADESRCAGCGAWLRGNVGALTHGGRRRRALTERQARDTELYHQWARDLGGLDTLSTAQQEVLVGTVAAVLIRQTAERFLSSARLSLSSEKAQAALSTFFKADDSMRRGAALLGLQRKTKRVETLEDYMAQHADGERGDGE